MLLPIAERGRVNKQPTYLQFKQNLILRRILVGIVLKKFIDYKDKSDRSVHVVKFSCVV